LDSRDFPAWSLLEQPWIVSGLKDTACMAGVAAPEEFLVTADPFFASPLHVLITGIAAISPRGEENLHCLSLQSGAQEKYR